MKKLSYISDISACLVQFSCVIWIINLFNFNKFGTIELFLITISFYCYYRIMLIDEKYKGVD